MRSSLLALGLPLEIFAPVLAITIVAKLGAFLPGYAIDDYALASAESRVPLAALLGQGRFGQAAVLELLLRLGLQPHYARFFFVGMAMAVTAACATQVVKLWRVESTAVAVLAAALIAVHPFTTEIFTFRTALGLHAIAFALLSPLLVPRRWTWRTVVMATLAFALDVSIYQVVLQFMIMVLIVGLAIDLASSLRQGPSLHPAGGNSKVVGEGRLRDGRLVLAGVTAGGTVLYLATNTVLLRVFKVTMVPRGRILDSDLIVARIHDVWIALRYRFLEHNPMAGAASRTLLLVLVALALVGLAARSRTLPFARSLPRLAGVVLLLFLGILWTVGFAALVEFFWPVPRTMAHVAVLWAGILVIAHIAWGVRARWALNGLAILILVTFIGTDNHILGDQLRLNVRDLGLANRILARLEAEPGFTPSTAVALVGLKSEYQLPFATSDMDMNFSAFGASWANLAILRELSGYNLQDPGAKGAAVAAERCRAAALWPAPSAVTVENGLAIVCLSTPPATP